MGKMGEWTAVLLGKPPAAFPHFDEQNGCSRANCDRKAKSKKTYGRFSGTILRGELPEMNVIAAQEFVN
jgi:hypothetical protein